MTLQPCGCITHVHVSPSPLFYLSSPHTSIHSLQPASSTTKWIKMSSHIPWEFHLKRGALKSASFFYLLHLVWKDTAAESRRRAMTEQNSNLHQDFSCVGSFLISRCSSMWPGVHLSQAREHQPSETNSSISAPEDATRERNGAKSLGGFSRELL